MDAITTRTLKDFLALAVAIFALTFIGELNNKKDFPPRGVLIGIAYCIGRRPNDEIRKHKAQQVKKAQRAEVLKTPLQYGGKK